MCLGIYGSRWFLCCRETARRVQEAAPYTFNVAVGFLRCLKATYRSLSNRSAGHLHSAFPYAGEGGFLPSGKKTDEVEANYSPHPPQAVPLPHQGEGFTGDEGFREGAETLPYIHGSGFATRNGSL